MLVCVAMCKALKAHVFDVCFSGRACKGFARNVQIFPLCARILRNCGCIGGYVQSFQGTYSDIIAMWMIFEALWWSVCRCARVLRKTCLTFACIVAACKGFKGKV